MYGTLHAEQQIIRKQVCLQQTLKAKPWTAVTIATIETMLSHFWVCLAPKSQIEIGLLFL